MTAVIKNWVCWVSCVLFLGLLGPLEVSALQCVPANPDNNNPQPSTGVSVCEGGGGPLLDQPLSAMTVSYPSNGSFTVTKEFQIRSCGRFGCARPAYFNVRSAGVTLNNATSEIPLTVSIEQTEFEKSVDFPVDNACNSDNCDFRGAGTGEGAANPQLLRCEECLDFKLTIGANLNDLIKEGKLTQSGKHSGTLTFIIDQAPSTAGITAGDANVDWPVNLYIELDIPDFIQISGLGDMTLNSSDGTGTQRFCVYTTVAQTFSLMPASKNGEPDQGGLWSDFRLSNEAENYLRYSMNIDDGTKNYSFFWGSYNGSLPPVHTGWKPSNVLDCSAGKNMELTISIYDDIDAAPAGVYSDTMEITVYPE
ncbi:hypothetical protein [Endozoicomonas sp. GU-1]|uniref:hypothetical protein n=1 Tax=Endozoicomonas sp. GU-1 TaxID=3009078 RepID=UPI0022B3A878|nr:hypothetical protein [Endozoicomonas sp. GU-1]WBA80891.1 hypothetical protein O2T12_21700 [Endozoicomonas sp. GU-1]WBA88454.1 hypothetical protein O3276_10885 [Endozoicomonas sp. GU-1]